MVKKSSSRLSSLIVISLLVLAITACDQETGSGKAAGREVNTAEVGQGTDVAPATANPTTMVLATIDDLAYTSDFWKSQNATPKIIFSEQGRGVIYLAEVDGKQRLVHNGKPGKPYSLISHMRITPDGLHVAHDAKVNGKRQMVVDGREGPAFDDVWPPVFSPDGKHIAYTAQVGEKYLTVIDGVASEAAPESRSDPVFSFDSTRVAFTVSGSGSQKGRLVVTDLSAKTLFSIEVLDEKPVVSEDKKRLAAIVPVGSQQKVVEFDFSGTANMKSGPVYTSIEHVVFRNNGSSLVYIARKGSQTVMVIDGREENIPDCELREPPVVSVGKKSSGAVLVTKDGWYYYKAFSDKNSHGKKYSQAAMLTYGPDSLQYAHCAMDGKRIFMVVNGHEGPAYDMVVSPTFSPDGRYVIYRARKDGKRFVVVSDLRGRVVREHPRYEMVFDTVFTADGKSVAYGVKDGQQLIWKVEKL